MVRKAIGLWLLFLILAIANGAVRESVLIPRLGKARGLPLSAVLLSALILATTIVFIPTLGRLGAAQYWLLGAAWLAAAVLFEFLFGRYVSGNSWNELFQAYNVFTGNLWSMVLLVMLISPYVAAKIRGLL